MTEEPASSRETRAPLTDPIGLALTGIGAGATAGATAITLGVLVLRLLQEYSIPPGAETTVFVILSASVMAGPVIGAATTMFVTQRITDLWRRSVAAAIAVFCAFLLSGLAAPIDMLVGGVGLVGFSLLLFTACVFLIRRGQTIARH